VRLGCAPASRRSTLNEIEPGTLPLRDSGTGSEAQEKEREIASGQGVKVIDAAPAGCAASAPATSAQRTPAGIVMMARLRIPGRR
jgi:hypothetical protein